MIHLKTFPFLVSASLIFLASCTSTTPQMAPELPVLETVNPFIGTGGHGHTYPGATAPFGMVQLSPDTRLEGWDGCSGYHYSDSIVYGFSHTHLSGTGIGDYLDVLLMPTIGAVNLHNGADGKPGYRSVFQKENEQASAGYYSVILDNSDTKVELTATERVGFHQYSPPQGTDMVHVVLDLRHRDKLLDYEWERKDDHTLVGKRISRDWANEQHVYFALKTEQPMGDLVGADGLATMASDTALAIPLVPNEQGRVLIKVGLSAVDVEGALANLEAEVPGWDFDATKNQTQEAWEAQLGKVKARFHTKEDQTNYYTALYHNSVVPNVWSDLDGRYRGMDGEIHQGDPAHPRYTVFSLWDTYRATHPFYSLTEPTRQGDFVRTFIGMYQEGGKLPMWELAGNYTGTMIGYHAVPVILDAYVKGITDFDVELAVEAMMSTAEADELGKEYHRELGYIPMNKEGESVSKTLEYAYNDWVIAEMLSALGRDEEAKTYYTRAQAFKNLFDPESGFMRGKQAHRWAKPFRPDEVNFNYTEANSWQYSFYVPQDVAGLAALHGGPDQLATKLDDLFTAESNLAGRQQPDITGLIGQYAHGNEPSHHMAYLYTYLGQAWKTQQRVQQIMNEQYQAAPDGLSGNEDCGQMSGWYLFSALGFYPVTPGSDYYVFGSPRVTEAALPLENGNVLRVEVANAKPGNDYIQSVRWNGEEYPYTYIRHADLVAGCTLEFVMGDAPNADWGKDETTWPPSAIDEHLLMPVPALSQGKRAFQFKDTVALNHPVSGTKIYYSVDGTDPLAEQGNASVIEYTLPFQVEETTTLKAVAIHPELGTSDVIETEFLKIPSDWSIMLPNAYSVQYTAGGDQALIDGLRGGADFKTGEWQGYHGVNVEALIDLGDVQDLSTVSPSFLQDENSWIFMPTAVEVWIAREEGQWEYLGKQSPSADPHDKGTILEALTFEASNSVRYIKVVATNRGLCPDWHKGAGGKAWIFTDEVVIQ